MTQGKKCDIDLGNVLTLNVFDLARTIIQINPMQKVTFEKIGNIWLWMGMLHDNIEFLLILLDGMT